MRTRVVLIAILLLGVALVAMAATGDRQPPASQYTSDFGLDPREVLLPDAGNWFFSLRAGAYLRLEGEDDGRSVQLETTVLEQTRRIFFPVDGRRTMAITRVTAWVSRSLSLT